MSVEEGRQPRARTNCLQPLLLFLPVPQMEVAGRSSSSSPRLQLQGGAKAARKMRRHCSSSSSSSMIHQGLEPCAMRLGLALV